MKQLDECILENVLIEPSQLQQIISKFSLRSIKKGDYLLKAGGRCQELVFIKKGYLRMYDFANGKEITFWIGNDGSFLTSLSSFIFQTPNIWNIQAVTDCELLVIQRTDHFELLEKYPKWMEVDNLILAKAFAMLEQSMFAQLHTTAQQRYQFLFENNPDIFKYVPLQYIASMIGVTPETMSRLRKNQMDSIS